MTSFGRSLLQLRHPGSSHGNVLLLNLAQRDFLHVFEIHGPTFAVIGENSDWILQGNGVWPSAMGYTLAQLRTAITPTAFPIGASTGTMNTLINRARERIYNTNVGGGWKGGDVTVSLTIATDVAGLTQFVTLPFGIESIIGVYGTSGDYDIQNEWFAFTRAAPGQSPGTPNGVLQDLGSGFVTFIDLPATGLQPVFSVTGGSTAIVIVGVTTAGTQVTETVTTSTTATAANTYTSFTSIELPGGTVVTMKDASGNVYAIYQAGETTVDWRCYQLTQKTADTVLTARCRRKYVPLVGDTTQSDIDNIEALTDALRAIRAYDANDYITAGNAIRSALWLLNGQYARYETEPEIGAAQLDSLASAGSIRNIL